MKPKHLFILLCICLYLYYGTIFVYNHPRFENCVCGNMEDWVLAFIILVIVTLAVALCGSSVIGGIYELWKWLMGKK